MDINTYWYVHCCGGVISVVPLSQLVEYSVRSKLWDWEDLEMIGSLPRKLYAVPEYNSPSKQQTSSQPVSTTGNTADKHRDFLQMCFNALTHQPSRWWSSGPGRRSISPGRPLLCPASRNSAATEEKPDRERRISKTSEFYYNVKQRKKESRHRVTWSRNPKEETVVLIFRKVVTESLLSKHQGSSDNIETDQNVT